jgi:hypothetical protein
MANMARVTNCTGYKRVIPMLFNRAIVLHGNTFVPDEESYPN